MSPTRKPEAKASGFSCSLSFVMLGLSDIMIAQLVALKHELVSSCAELVRLDDIRHPVLMMIYKALC